MTHPTLTRASIAVAAIILAARGHAQTGEPQDPVARERARIEAAARGDARSEVDEELRRFVAQALILGNESDVKKLGAAAAPPLRDLCANASLGELAAFNPNPIKLLAPLSPEDAVATLRGAYASDVARFVFLCSADDGLARVAYEASRQGRQGVSDALAAQIDAALAGDELTPTQREAIAVGAVRGGLRSQTIDDVAIGAPDLLALRAEGGDAGLRLYAERKRRIGPWMSLDVARALLEVDVDAFYAQVDSTDEGVQSAVLRTAPWTPELRGRTLEALLELSRSEHEDVRNRALQTVRGRADQLRTEDLQPRFAERRGEMIEAMLAMGEGFRRPFVHALLRCAEGAGRDVLLDTVRALLDGATPDRLSDISGWARGAERPVESILAIWEAMASSGERSLNYVKGALVERLQNRTPEEQARLAQAALEVTPDLEEAWKPLMHFAPLSELPAGLAVRSVRVLTAKTDAWVGELFEAAPAWQGVGEGLRAIIGDPSEELRTRLTAAAVLLRTGEARADDAALVRDLLLAADVELPPYDALARFTSSDLTFPTAAAVEARNRAVVDAWNARLDEGKALRFGALSRAIASAPEALRADALALARRALGGPHADDFFTANGGPVIRLIESAAPGGGDGFELVAAAVATDRGTASHFDVALERGFERAALEGGLRRAESGVLYSGNNNGERYSKPFLSRLVGLPAFRAEAANALRLSEALAARGDVELMGFAKEALEEIAALKEVAARIANPTDAAAADAAPDLRATLYQWIEAGLAEGADETTYEVGAIAVRTLAELGDPRDRDFFRGLIESPIYAMDSGAAGVLFRDYLRAWAQR